MKSTKPNTIDEYIASFPKDIKLILETIRTTIQKTVPKAQEKIGYGMPSFRIYGKDLVYFAAFSNHIGVYALPSGNAAFKNELVNYKTGKGSIQFPLDQPIPYDLIVKIVKFREQENLALSIRKTSGK